MSIKLHWYLIRRWVKYKTKLDYRLTQMELLELGAGEKTLEEFRMWWDGGGCNG